MQGTNINYTTMTDQHISKLVQNNSNSSIELDPSNFLTTSQLTFKFARMRAKAVGESAIGGELFSIAPKALAKVYFPLTTKLCYIYIHPYSGMVDSYILCTRVKGIPLIDPTIET